MCGWISLNWQKGEFHSSDPLKIKDGCIWPLMLNEFDIPALYNVQKGQFPYYIHPP